MLEKHLPSTNFTQTEAFARLTVEKSRVEDLQLLDWFKTDSNRFDRYSRDWSGLFLDFSKNKIDDTIFNLLIELANECKLNEAINLLYSGIKINKTENRAVMHMALRNPINSKIQINQEDIVPIVHETLDKMEKLAHQILQGTWTGYSGKKITDVVNLGIGGSDLGPKMITEALRPYHQNLRVHYVSNMDPNEIWETLNHLDPATTLFVVASKTFSTLETIANAKIAKEWILKASNAQNSNLYKNHFIAATSNHAEATKFGIPVENQLDFWDWVGGRFSAWSSVGFSCMLAIGPTNFRELLQGAHEADEHFKNTAFKDNLPVILAMLDVWNQNFLGCETLAIIPYYHYLKEFPAYVQQLEMESNGKNLDRSGHEVDYQTGRIVWGGVGTNGQHAFFQLLHQGTKKIAIDFIGVINNQKVGDEEQPFLSSLHSDNHKTLLANLLAQSKALLEGDSTSEEKHKNFAGNKSSNTLLLDTLCPKQLGKLMAIFEHKTFVQGVIWNVFSFDQWGVELGKKLTKEILPKISSKKSEDTTPTGDWDSSTNGLIQRINKLA